jgi:hypothetical protein
MTDDRRNESQEPAKPTLARRDLAEGRWRGVWFYAMTAMRERYGADYGRPVHREKRDDPVGSGLVGQSLREALVAPNGDS